MVSRQRSSMVERSSASPLAGTVVRPAAQSFLHRWKGAVNPLCTHCAQPAANHLVPHRNRRDGTSRGPGEETPARANAIGAPTPVRMGPIRRAGRVFGHRRSQRTAKDALPTRHQAVRRPGSTRLTDRQGRAVRGRTARAGMPGHPASQAAPGRPGRPWICNRTARGITRGRRRPPPAPGCSRVPPGDSPPRRGAARTPRCRRAVPAPTRPRAGRWPPCPATRR